MSEMERNRLDEGDVDGDGGSSFIVVDAFFSCPTLLSDGGESILVLLVDIGLVERSSGVSCCNWTRLDS